jgi:hypothetical protein
MSESEFITKWHVDPPSSWWSQTAGRVFWARAYHLRGTPRMTEMVLDYDSLTDYDGDCGSSDALCSQLLHGAP